MTGVQTCALPILAIETRANNAVAREVLAKLDDPFTRNAVTAERSLLNALGGGCQVPIGAHAETDEIGQSTFLRQLVDGCEQLQSALISGPQFAGLLRSAYQRLQQAQKAQARLPSMDPFGLQALGARQMLTGGLEQMSQALELLHEYLVEQKTSTLSKAVRQLVAAGRALEQVRDL